MLSNTKTITNIFRHKFSNNSAIVHFQAYLSTTTKPQTKSPPLVLLSHNHDAKTSTITLNAPETLNALTVAMGHQFQSTIQTLTNQIQTSAIQTNCLILTGSGKAFSSGGDLKWLKSLRNEPHHVNAERMYNFYKSFLCVRTLPIPVIAAVNGPAVGAGACLALSADVTILSPDAKVGFPFSTLGIHAGMGGSHFLPLRMGRNHRCNEILLRGEILTSGEAVALGVAGRVVEDGCVLEEAERVARDMSLGASSLAVRGMIRTLRTREDEGLEVALRREADQQAFCYGRNDWGEGIDAVLERRRGNFGDFYER
mmetsp:Transcript_12651/g.15962  ORF Transcript_12651/g.15962 Transcript_12651/m.15962 type:complete len:312 (+) Transcript_12651:126-1061(+)